jgi:4-amino-4-deoxy-L-arabinose transferase-like glycosyltransferase
MMASTLKRFCFGSGRGADCFAELFLLGRRIMPEVSSAVRDAKVGTRFELSPRLIRAMAAALLVILGVLLFASVRQESQTFDESNHLYAGYAYWKHGDFGRNPEHPPLAKLLASLPLLRMGLKEPAPRNFPYFKAQDFTEGSQFLYGGDADAILLRARLMIGLFSIGLGLLVFFAAREMFGDVAALIALFLFVFEPNLLANGALVTTDMPLACLFFASVYGFYRYAKAPSVARLALFACATAFAIATKQSGLLILPVLVLLAVIVLFTDSGGVRRGRILQLVYALVAIGVVSYVFLWAIYGFRFAMRPGQLQMIPSFVDYASYLTHPLQRNVILFCGRHHLLPEAYLYGWIDILQISSSRSTFVFGHLYSRGQWFFFPGVFLIKSTIALLVLLALVPFARIGRRWRELLFMTVPAGFFWGVAIASMLNLGVRHLLPVYPFCIVLAGAAAASFAMRSVVGRVAVAGLLVFTMISSLRCFPDFLAYSNEIAGGPSHSYRLVTDSNADWGQGLKWTKRYLDQHPTKDCFIDYAIPVVNPAYYGVNCQVLLNGMGHLVGIGAKPLPSTITGTVFLSATDNAGLLWGPGTLNPYAVFRDREPDAMIGNVVLVYRGTFAVPLLAAETDAVAARGLLWQHRVAEALPLAQQAAQEAPDSAEVHRVLADALVASGKTEEAKAEEAETKRLARASYPEFQAWLVK